jgi:lysophospholipase L1-like esterase
MPATQTDRLQGLTTSVAVKPPCKAVTTSAIALNGEQTVGGMPCVSGDRVLVAIAGGSISNGIWVVDTGAWERARDFDGNRDVVQGTIVLVTPGVAAKFWQVQTANPIVIGATSIVIAAIDPSALSVSANQMLFDFDTTYLSGSIGLALSTLKQYSVIDVDAIQQLMTDVAAGTSRIIACFGDSTMWGADPSNLANQVAVPPPAALQNFVNNYHGNTALTVTNNAISGTTLTQMIAGTDGSGSTFAAKMAVSTARIVIENHGINDAEGVNATTLAQYKAAMLSFIYTCRLYGKTPVMVTPFPALTFGTFGSQSRAEKTSRFAEEKRKVARDHSVLLIDNNLLMSRLLNIDGQLPLSILPDGVHASQGGYGFAGNNLAGALLESQMEAFSRPAQRLPSSASAIKATSQTVSASSTSRVGVVVTTSTGVPQTMRMVFRVDEPGLDLVLSHPVFSNGSASIALNMDGAPLGTLSMLSSGFTSSFWQDYETVIARNLAPGYHVLLMTTASTGGIGLHCIRSRDTEKPLILPNGFSVPSQRKLLAPRLELNSANANTMAVFDDLPVSFLIDAATVEWTGQMLKDSAVIIGGNVGSNGGSAACERAISIMLNPATGYLSVQEATAPGTYTANAPLAATDQSAASHTFRVVLTNVNPTSATAQVFVDGVSIGTQALTGPFRGGLLGLWKNQAGGSLAVTGVHRVWGL